jgi:hypothetical protein
MPVASDALSLVANTLTPILVLASEGTFAYAAYWAFKIRGALTIRVYRSHALGVGLVSLGWILVFFDYVVVSHFSYVLFTAIDALVSGAFFYFIDAAVLDGRISDPLLRDSLHWRRIRRWMWAIFALASAVSIYIAGYYSVLTGGTWLTGGNPSLVPLWVSFVGTSLHVFVVMTTGLVTLPITIMRSRDPLLRRQLGWFAGFAAALVVVGTIPTLFGLASTSPVYTLPEFVGQFVAALCLYKSAISLIPHGIRRGS